MSGIDLSTLDYDALCELRDEVAQRILELRQHPSLRLEETLFLFEEAKLALAERGVRWHSLERWQWIDGEVRFWVNPVDQARYCTGWYNLVAVTAWLTDSGPIVRPPAADIPFQWIAIDELRD
ncbi:MAG: hypothetical protein RLZZ297_1653 [Chloroflexota bacterium]|jgi:hypothetical protein